MKQILFNKRQIRVFYRLSIITQLSSGNGGIGGKNLLKNPQFNRVNSVNSPRLATFSTFFLRL